MPSADFFLKLSAGRRATEDPTEVIASPCSPSLLDRDPHRAHNTGADDEIGDQARHEIRIHHQRDTRCDLRVSLLLPAVREQHETEAARDEREEQQSGIKGHATILTRLAPTAVRHRDDIRTEAWPVGFDECSRVVTTP